MEGHVPWPTLCHILLILTVVVLSLLGQVSGRATPSVELTETLDDHTVPVAGGGAIPVAGEGERKRRDVGGGSHHSPAIFLCPQQHLGVNYQCLDQGICQPHDVWQGASCAGSSHKVCCRVGLGTASALASSGGQQGHVDYYSLPRNMLTQLINPEAMDMIKTYTPTLRCGAKSPIKSQQCLHRGRIASGNEDAEACFGEWPWHVALLEKQRHKCSKSTLSDYDRWRLRCHIVHPVDLYRYICGGTLISSNHVLTAAHCVKGVRQDRLKLHLGDYNLYSSARELLPELQRSVKEAHIHEGYDPYTYEDDLAILTLDKAVDFRLTPHIGPVCLPAAHHDFIENSHCTIVGWGEDPYKPNHGSNILKSVDVTIGSEAECEDRLGQSFTLGRHQLCIVGNLGTDACLGDGGGAVVCPIKADADHGRHYRGSSNAPDQYFMAGIISWGSESCGENSVTVINLVNPYLNWLGQKTAPPRQYYEKQPYGTNTNNCRFNPFLQTVQASGYGALAGKHLTINDISCVFGEQFTSNPSYKIWYDSVYGHGAGTVQGTGTIQGTGAVGTGLPTTGTSSLCNANPFFQKVDASGYGAITGMSLALNDIKCVFGEEFTANPNYKVWFDSVHGTTTGTVTGTGIPTSGTGVLTGTVQDTNTVTSAGATDGQGIGVGTVNSCIDNKFAIKVEEHGYQVITGTVMSLEDIKCVFGEDFTKNPSYNQYFVSVYCIQTDGPLIPAVCCESTNFNHAACCGLGKHNPPGLC